MKKHPCLTLPKLIIYLIFTSASINTITAQDCPGDISLNSQQDVNAFSCTTIAGSLTIQGEDITDMSPLTGLISVGGNLNIEHNNLLTNIDGLSDLASIEGNLNIERNDLLTNIDGLSGLTSVGGSIWVRNNDTLANIDGFSNINQLVESIYIWDNEALSNLDVLANWTSIGENLEIKFNPSLSNNLQGLINITTVGNNLDINAILGLENLSGLSNLESVGKHLIILNCHGLSNLEGLGSLSFLGGSLNISHNDGLTNLNGLDMLTSIGNSLAIQYCDGLIDLSGLENITTVFIELRIFFNYALISLNGLDNITSIGRDLTIQYNSTLKDFGALAQITSLDGTARVGYNPNLISLNGLNNITSIEGSIHIQGNGALTSLEGLDNIVSVGEFLVIDDNNVLETIDNLTNLTSVGGVFAIQLNDALTNLDGLINLEVVGEDLGIWSNDALTNIDGLIHLSSVGRRLSVRFNNALTNLDGLANITSVGAELKVENNFSLSNCCGLFRLLCSNPPNCTSDGVTDWISIFNNNLGCTSPEEIISGGLCSPRRIYVDQTGNSFGTGRSWENALLELSDAIEIANEGDAIWVADGIYFPTASSDRSKSFVLEQGVAIFGGFQGNETTLEQRDITLYETILSGDIGVVGDSTDNSYHVVYTLGTDNTAILDGFTIKAGHAAEEENSNFDGGGGLLVDTDELHPMTSPIIRNCTFVGNTAQYGGAIHCNGLNDRFANPEISFCNFYDNHALGSGGAIYKNGATLPDQIQLISDCVFENNSANKGGGIYLSNNSSGNSILNVKRSKFINNQASNSLGGGITYEGSLSTPHKNKMTITNSLFAHNDGAILYEGGNPSAADGLIKNCTFFNNGLYPLSKNWSADFDYVDNYNLLEISNCIIWEPSQPLSNIFHNGLPDNTHLYDYTIHYNLISAASCDLPEGDEACGEGNIFDFYPGFFDVSNMDFRVAGCSPAINVGLNAGLDTLGIYFDLGGEIRILEEVVDMGAYEIMQSDSISATYSTNSASQQGVGDGSIILDNISGGVTPFTYFWNTNETTASIADLVPGIYYLTISDANGCQALLSFEVELSVGNNFPETEKDPFKIFPNPVKGELYIESKTPWNSIILFDYLGRQMREWENYQPLPKNKLDFSGLPSGIYFLYIRSDKGIWVKKVIIQTTG